MSFCGKCPGRGTGRNTVGSIRSLAVKLHQVNAIGSLATYGLRRQGKNELPRRVSARPRVTSLVLLEILSVIILSLFVSVGECATGTLYFRGPTERGEGDLPLAEGDEPGLFGEFTVDIYAEDFPGFAGFQVEVDFPEGFYVAFNNIPPESGPFGDRAITWNDDFLPDIREVYTGQTMGLMSTEREFIPPFSWGDYIDKTIPPEEDDEAVNPEEMVWESHEGLTWLMSITYWYDTSAEGTYTIDAKTALTTFGDADDPPNDLPYTVVTGSVTIGSGDGGGGGGGGGDTDEDDTDDDDGGGGGGGMDSGETYYVDDSWGGAQDGSAEYPYKEIGRGITEASNGDEIRVAGGTGSGLTYQENLSIGINVDLSGGWQRSGSTWSHEPDTYVSIIDGSGDETKTKPCVKYTSTVAGTISYFTITKGKGGIVCDGPYPTEPDPTIIISYNKITGNPAVGNNAPPHGGGINCQDGSATITFNEITNNEGYLGGGGIFSWRHLEEDPNTVEIEGNTISNNESGGGGGIYAWQCSSLTISGNSISGNEASTGGGLKLDSNGEELLEVTDNVIVGNDGGGGGGGIWWYQDGTLANNLIVGNYAFAGGGIFLGNATQETFVILLNNTISGNRVATDGYGGGIFAGYCDPLTMKNCILWDNEAWRGPQIALEDSTATVSYSDVEGGQNGVDRNQSTLNWGSGNIDTDPLFADPGHWDDNGTSGDESDDFWVNGDYHLTSDLGRWDPTAEGGSGGWVDSDILLSPCIDSGDPSDDDSNEPMPGYPGGINMGAYGNTSEASKSGWYIEGDTVADCRVNILDMLFVRDNLNKDISDTNWRCEVTGDGNINILDMILVRNHLNTVCPD